MQKFLFIFFFCIVSVNLFAQADSTRQANYDIDSLKNIYGNNKKLLKDFELQSLIALSYYPELLNEHIRFEYEQINSTARTTVTLISIFKKINKQYIIYINDDILKTGFLLKTVPFNAQVAVIAHELAHVADFKRRSFFDMVWWGISYLIVKQRTKIEMRTDQSTIKHGLGWPLYQWADFVLYHSTANKRYKKIKETKYMQPDKILKYMHQLNLL